MWSVVVLIAVAAAVLLMIQGPRPCDDAYITFRHAKNLALEWRPAWNLEGPPVLGSTSPAMVFLLALPAMIIGVDHIPTIALGINASLLFVIVVLSYLIALDLLRRRFPAVLIAALVGFNSVSIFVFSLGFENALLLAVILGGLYSIRVGCPALALTLASVAPLVRPEGLILSVLVWAHIVHTRDFRLKLLAVWAAIPLLWLTFAFAYYGSPVLRKNPAKRPSRPTTYPTTPSPLARITSAPCAMLAG